MKGDNRRKPSSLSKASTYVQSNQLHPTSVTVALVFLLIILRSLVGLHPHSGESEDHNNEATYGGDFEAQRHWMEITLHLPISSWYHHDLQYWGLDYPPLTAYVSYVCGWFSNILVGPHSVSLYTSRGIEDPIHKSFMRATVLLLDLAVYFPAVWVAAKQLHPGGGTRFLWTVVLSLSQPAIILIDHGHFQYNTVALGLALWSFYFMTKGKFSDCVLGSIFFCLALNFKQMTLYYAPAIFAYLLGRCFSNQGTGPSVFWRRFTVLGVTVIMSFAVLWWPFFVYEFKSDEVELSGLQSAGHVLQRLFPFQRGLFEGKVANLWCALSTKPISIRQRIPEDQQPIMALLGTFVLIAPITHKLFQTGYVHDGGKKQGEFQLDHDFRTLLWGSCASGLSFFLASFQVHEKSILMALAPISLLITDSSSAFVSWFSLVSFWTLWPLLTVDRLHIAYVTTGCIFVALLLVYSLVVTTEQEVSVGFVMKFTKYIVLPCSFVVMGCLHVAEICYDAPEGLPDLFPVLWSVCGCGFYCWAWLYCIFTLFFAPLEQQQIYSAKSKLS